MLNKISTTYMLSTSMNSRVYHSMVPRPFCAPMISAATMVVKAFAVAIRAPTMM